MVLYESRAGDGFLEIGVETSVVVVESQCFGGGNVAISVEHSDFVVDRFEAHVAIVRNVKLRTMPLLGGHLYHSRGTTRTVGGRLCSIFQYCETGNVGRIDATQGREVAVNAVDDDQRVVATGEGGGSSHAHGTQHGHAVVTGGSYVYTNGLTGKGIKGGGDETFFHARLIHHIYRTALSSGDASHELLS